MVAHAAVLDKLPSPTVVRYISGGFGLQGLHACRVVISTWKFCFRSSGYYSPITRVTCCSGVLTSLFLLFLMMSLLQRKWRRQGNTASNTGFKDFLPE